MGQFCDPSLDTLRQGAMDLCFLPRGQGGMRYSNALLGAEPYQQHQLEGLLQLLAPCSLSIGHPAQLSKVVGMGMCVQPGAGALEQNERRLIPTSRQGAVRCSPALRGQPGTAAACRGCCCAGGGCWLLATCWVAAGTAVAQAGTTPAGPPVHAALAAIATRTVRGQVTAARTTRLRAAVPVSRGAG